MGEDENFDVSEFHVIDGENSPDHSGCNHLHDAAVTNVHQGEKD